MINQFWETLDGVPSTGQMFSPQNILLSLLLAFILSQALAWVYYFTHSGLSYSRTFVQSLILICVVVAMIMAVIGNNIITAFGLMGALAIIRFRNVVKDTRDIVFVFCALVIGMASGSQRYAIAIVGTITLCLISIYLHFTAFGSHQPHNGFLRFSIQSHITPGHPVLKTLKKFCENFTLVSVQDNTRHPDASIEYAYQLMVKNSKKNEMMLAQLQNIQGLKDITLTMQEQLLEI